MARAAKINASIPSENALLKENTRLFNDANNIDSMEKLLVHTIDCVKQINKIHRARGNNTDDYKGHLFSANNALHKGFKTYRRFFADELSRGNKKIRRGFLGPKKTLKKWMIEDWKSLNSIVQENKSRLPKSVVNAVAQIGGKLQLK